MYNLNTYLKLSYILFKIIIYNLNTLFKIIMYNLNIII